MLSTRTQYRINPVIKKKAEEILVSQGIKPAQAITMFFTEIARIGGFPFLPSRVPNKKLEKTLRDVEKGIGLTTYKNTKKLFKSLEKL